MGQRRLDLVDEIGRIGLAVGVIIGADLGRNGEAGRNGQAQIGHFGQIGALAAEQVLHRAGAFGLAVAE